MFRSLKKLFGIDEAPPAQVSDPRNNSKGIIRNFTNTEGRSSEYFMTLAKFQEAISKRDYNCAAQFVRKNMRQIPAFVRNSKLEYGSFGISLIPALQKGGTILALVGDAKGLKEMREIISTIPELMPWSSSINQHEKDMRLFASILKVVAKNPGCLQKEVKNLIGADDGRRLANLISWLEKAKKIVRIKKGRSFELIIAGSDHDAIAVPKRQAKSHRNERNPLRCRELDLRSLPYVPLPRAPLRWEDLKEKDTSKSVKEASEWFEIHNTTGWKILSVEKIPLNERPDPAFRQIYPIDTGLMMVDDLGNSEKSGSAPAAVLYFGREGIQLVEASLYHDIYRTGVNALGRGLIAMSRDCVAHAYDDELNQVLETSLRDSPEVCALRQRLAIGADELKNHLRCIAMAYDNSRYLATGVDEAWCVNMEGRGLWAVKLPIKEGWSRVTEPSGIFGTSADVVNALEVMKLTLPFTVEEFKRRYRELAKQWHPDLNPENPNAEERMKALTSAAEILTGIHPSTIARYAGATFMKEFSREEFSAGNIKFSISMGVQLSEIHAADWIYSANFAGRTHDVFLAGYSGKIIQVNGEGQPVRAYDIGAVPRQIVDTGNYLYFLTDTRLYTLQGDSLVALMDTSEGGKLLIAQTGLGLLQNKCFQWFSEEGKQLGTVATKNPIRRIYYGTQGMVVETRQRRAIIEGVKPWWA